MSNELPHTSREAQQQYETLSPFELTARLGELARARDAQVALGAGRGNPNWVVTAPRDAFFELGRFAVAESRRVWDDGLLGACRRRPERPTASMPTSPRWPTRPFARCSGSPGRRARR